MGYVGDIYESRHNCKHNSKGTHSTDGLDGSHSESQSESDYQSVFAHRALPRCPRCFGDADITVIRHEVPSGPVEPHSLVIKVTGKSSFASYTANSLLHVGLSDSHGTIFNFDERGLHIDSPTQPAWSDCLSISLCIYMVNGGVESGDSDIWDANLRRHHQDELDILRYRPYHTLTNNCYSYVIRFLNYISWNGRNDHTATGIVDNVVMNEIQKWESHVRVYEAIKASRGGYILELEASSNAHVHVHICDGTNCGKRVTKYYKCTICDDYDLCVECISNNHNHVHDQAKFTLIDQ